MLDAKTWLDIDILGVGTYLNNDLLYLRKTKIPDLIRATDLSSDAAQFNQDRNRYHAYSRTFVNALIGTLSWRDHAFGIHFGGRAYVDARNVDNVVSHFIENGVTNYTPQHLTDYSIKRLRANALVYGQAQISYAYTFKKQKKEMWMAGFSFKKIFPIVGAGVSIHDMGYNVRDDIQMSIFYLQADMMGAISPQFSWKGGWGLDLGFTYQKMLGPSQGYYPNSRKGGCRRNPYKWKLGISVLDLGYAKFDPSQVGYTGYDFTSYEFFNYADVSPDETNFQDILIDAEPNPTEGLIRKPYKMSLPAAVSVQYDYAIKPSYLYLNISAMQGIPRTKGAFGPRRASWISISPRFESKWFELSTPISIYEYQKLQLGLHARLLFLTVGTDKLGSWLFRSDLYGTDIYVMLKWPFFRTPKCKSKGSKGRGAGKRRGRADDLPHCDAYY